MLNYKRVCFICVSAGALKLDIWPLTKIFLQIRRIGNRMRMENWQNVSPPKHGAKTMAMTILGRVHSPILWRAYTSEIAYYVTHIWYIEIYNVYTHIVVPKKQSEKSDVFFNLCQSKTSESGRVHGMSSTAQKYHDILSIHHKTMIFID